MGCPIHTMLKKLRIFAGLPVPVVVPWANGKPDFRGTDPAQWMRCAKHRLCAVCGDKLGDWSYYVGGPKTLENGLFFDLGMHRACAEESTRLCPFLSGKRQDYRGDDVPESKLQDISNGRPERMFLMRGWTKSARLVELQGEVVMYAGVVSALKEF